MTHLCRKYDNKFDDSQLDAYVWGEGGDEGLGLGDEM
jgi:hypothetical protein